MSSFLKFLRRYPRSTLCVGVTGCAPFLNLYLKKIKVNEELYKPVYKKMEMGSRPNIGITDKNRMVPRDELSAMISEFLKLSPRHHEAGKGNQKARLVLVVGPSGTGKSVLMRDLCNKFPHGLLYLEVVEPASFPTGLAKEIGMKLSPSNVLDLVLGYVSNDYRLYHDMPKDKKEGLEMVMGVLEKGARDYLAKHGKILNLVIDGADVLAKNDEDLFAALVTHAKYLVNYNAVSVTLVSSEGSILPVVSKMSGLNRAPKIFEITDIPDDEATKYLVQSGLSKRLSVLLTNYYGGRLVHMVNSASLHEWYASFGEIDDGEMYKNILNDLFARQVNFQKDEIAFTAPFSQDLLRHLSCQDGIEKVTLLNGVDPQVQALREDVISRLIFANVLRYSRNGMLMWHGKVQKHEFSKK